MQRKAAAEARSNRRSTLLAVGRTLFERQGFRSVSIAQIAAEAGLSSGTFYNYFDSKEAFYDCLLDQIESEGMRTAEQIVLRLRSPMNKLRAVYHFITLGLRRNPILRGVLLHKPEYLYPGMNQRLQRSEGLRRYMERMVADIIGEGTRKGVFRTSLYNNPTALVTAVFDAIIIHIEDDDVDELLADLSVFLQRGLRRALRLRRRDERIDRRTVGEPDEWI
ncbi:MAG: TetR/AcrR family transcriptional regulator [Spirochaetaceae bacterium]|nr:MAG: TetR/AcrR family transcriptional regulator [Spirochaetaceae bacterium]